MKFISWIFIIACEITVKISGLNIVNRWADFMNGSMSTQSPAQNGFNYSSCRIRKGEKKLTFLDSSESQNRILENDQFLLDAYRWCVSFVTQNEKRTETDLLDHRNKSQLENSCRNINGNCVERLTKCCENASLCCVKQLKKISNSSKQICPMTWDGLLCFEEATENVTIKKPCPTFLSNLMFKQFAEKRCVKLNLNSTESDESDLSWNDTDYGNCSKVRIENEIIINDVKCYFLMISLVFLFISILIFISFRSLRSQQRIKVHINLFMSLFLRCTFDLTVTNLAKNTFLKNNNNINLPMGNACQWIIILLKYFQNSTFSWMLCEALLLHQLLFRTFEQITNIRKYLIIGWCVPLTYNIIYFFIRRFHPYYKDHRNFCDAKEPDLEYLIRIPNILFLMVNIVFLINIIRLIRNLPTQPFDTSYGKRTFKAVVVLVPLFGLQLLLVAFALEESNDYYLEYSVIQKVIEDSQGIAVSLAFCAFNQEVFNVLRQKFSFHKCTSRSRLRNSSQTNRLNNNRRHDSLSTRSIQRISNSVTNTNRDSVDKLFKNYQIPLPESVIK